jgi:hypothetical protein
VGAGLNLFPSTATVMADVYGADVNWNPELEYILKPLGAFMVALAILAAGAALDPLRYRLVIYGFVALFLMRAAQRVVFAQELQDTFGITWNRNLSNVAFFVGLAAVLVILDTLARRPARPLPSGSAAPVSTAS